MRVGTWAFVAADITWDVDGSKGAINEKNQRSHDGVHTAKQSLSRSMPLIFISIHFFNVQEKSRQEEETREAVWDIAVSPRWNDHAHRRRRSGISCASILDPSNGSRFCIISQERGCRSAQGKATSKSQCDRDRCISRVTVPAVPCPISATPFLYCFPPLYFVSQFNQVKNEPYAKLGGNLEYPPDPVKAISFGEIRRAD